MNAYFDIIQDEVIRALEEDLPLPDDFTITLPKEQMEALLKAGLSIVGTKQLLPLTTQTVLFHVVGRKVTVALDSTPEPTLH